MIGYNGFNNGLNSYQPPAAAAVAAGYGAAAAGSQNSRQYMESQIMNASPEKILIMLFDGAIRFTREAIKANNEGNIPRKLEKIGRVFNIIAEFSNTLDHNVGGEIADDLEALYQFNLSELGRARRDTTNRHLSFVENFLMEWRETWMDVIEINRAEKAGTQHAANGVAVAG